MLVQVAGKMWDSFLWNRKNGVDKIENNNSLFGGLLDIFEIKFYVLVLLHFLSSAWPNDHYKIQQTIDTLRYDKEKMFISFQCSTVLCPALIEKLWMRSASRQCYVRECTINSLQPYCFPAYYFKRRIASSLQSLCGYLFSFPSQTQITTYAAAVRT